MGPDTRPDLASRSRSALGQAEGLLSVVSGRSRLYQLNGRYRGRDLLCSDSTHTRPLEVVRRGLKAICRAEWPLFSKAVIQSRRFKQI